VFDNKKSRLSHLSLSLSLISLSSLSLISLSPLIVPKAPFHSEFSLASCVITPRLFPSTMSQASDISKQEVFAKSFEVFPCTRTRVKEIKFQLRILTKSVCKITANRKINSVQY